MWWLAHTLLVLWFQAYTFDTQQILNTRFRRCKPAWEKRIVGLIKRIKVNETERGLVVKTVSCRRRGRKQSMDEKRARFTQVKRARNMAAQQKTLTCVHYVNSSFNIKWTVATEATELLQQLLFFQQTWWKRKKNEHRDLARSIYFSEQLSPQQPPQQAACHCSGDLPKRCSARFKFFIIIIFLMTS